MKGIREKQRLLVQLLTTKAYKDGTLRDSTKLLLEETIEFCAKYERNRRPFPHDLQGPIMPKSMEMPYRDYLKMING